MYSLVLTKLFLGCLAGSSYNSVKSHSGGLGENPILAIAFACGMTIFLLICAFGHISGGHFNPAVTFGLALVRECHVIVAVLYIICQLLGSICGAILARVCKLQEMKSTYNV